MATLHGLASDWNARAGLWRSMVLYRRPWKERRRRDFYRFFIVPGQLCFDIGAHLGNHSAAWLALGARVIAVEPQPVFVQQLHRQLGDRDDLVILQKAISATRGRGRLAVSDRTPTVSTLAEDWRGAVGGVRSFRSVHWNRSLNVETVTLDSLIADFGVPGFCKLDIEGSEAQALAGLSDPIPQLSFEVTPGATEIALDCVERLSQLGDYEYNISLSERLTLVLDPWAGSTAICAWISSLAKDHCSGDIFARIRG